MIGNLTDEPECELSLDEYPTLLSRKLSSPLLLSELSVSPLFSARYRLIW